MRVRVIKMEFPPGAPIVWTIAQDVYNLCEVHKTDILETDKEVMSIVKGIIFRADKPKPPSQEIKEKNE